MEKIIYNKLVRDKIPEIIKADNSKPRIRILKQKQYVSELFKKLKEEIAELLKVKNNKEGLIKEVGDVYEVLEYIIKHCGLDKNVVRKLKRERRKKRGGFDKRIFLKSVEK